LEKIGEADKTEFGREKNNISLKKKEIAPNKTFEKTKTTLNLLLY
jgi:hypothetical protein